MRYVTVTTDYRTATFSALHPPAVRIQPGTHVTFETGDVAYARLHAGETVEATGLENFNLITGPVYVEGARPGDALRLHIDSVEIDRAWSVWMPGFGGLGRHTDAVQVLPVEVHGRWCTLSKRLRVPLAPMIGCIGVAPAEGEASTFMPAYPHGGNMDLRELSPGATLYLPVQVEGALLSAGDLHAAMGTAEPTGVSLEAAGRATVRVDVEPNLNLRFPRVRSGTSTFCLGMGDTLEAAHRAALEEAFALLRGPMAMTPMEAYAYASACVSMRLGGPVSPIVLAEVPDP